MPDLLPTSELLISHILSRILIVSVVPEEDDEDYEGEDDDKQESDDNRNHASACLFNLKKNFPICFPSNLNFSSLLVLLLRSESDLIRWNSIWLSIYRNSPGLSKINVSSLAGFCFLDGQKVFLYADNSLQTLLQRHHINVLPCGCKCAIFSLVWLICRFQKVADVGSLRVDLQPEVRRFFSAWRLPESTISRPTKLRN